jgi:hypothetical protein
MFQTLLGALDMNPRRFRRIGCVKGEQPKKREVALPHLGQVRGRGTLD